VEILSETLPPNLTGTTVIIRAHGISPALEEELRSRHAVLVDATCPHVKKNQLKARSLVEAGTILFIAGEEQHGEVIGLQGYAARSIVVANAREAAEAAARLRREDPGASAALIAQTTISAEEYGRIGEAVKAVFPGLEIIHSICNATEERQESLRELCTQVDAVVIVGGKDSSNTRRLLEIARSLGKKAWLVESAAELCSAAELQPLIAEIAGYQNIGRSAGASTPDSVIAEIEASLSKNT
jgi:4-hydroxy-3-methylbut-2-enyl diphosphate reductase